MRGFPPPLRFTLPAVLLAAGLAVQGLLLLAELRAAEQRAEERVVVAARKLGTLLGAEVETAFRTGREEVARNLVQHSASDPGLRRAALLDHAGRPVFDSRLRPSEDPAWRRRVEAAAARLADEPRMKVVVDRTDQAVVASFPVRLASGRAAGERGRYGLLLFVHDTARPRQAARAAAFRGAAAQGTVVLGGGLLLYLALRVLLLGRLGSLVEGARRLAQGDYAARLSLSGRDEIAEVGEGFDAMAGRIEARERALREAERKQRALLANLKEAVLVLDREGRVLEANAAAPSLLGPPASELLGLELASLFAEEDAGRLREALARLAGDQTPSEDLDHAELRSPSSGGTRLLDLVLSAPEASASLGAFIVSARDVTYRAEIERRSRQRDKMEAIGQLAGGIAHDFNNLLTVQTLGLAELRGLKGVETRAEGVLDDLEEACGRASDLTRQLLVFGGRDVQVAARTDAEACVASMARLLARLMPDDVSLEHRGQGRTAWVEMERSRLEQVIANLVINARDAVERGGRVRVETSRVEEPAPAVRILVADDGEGMTEEVRERIFEPFFTTKSADELGGTGLGLSVVYELVRRHGGEVSVESAPGRGSRFTVTLPTVGPPDPAGNAEVRTGRAALPVAGSILVVEDEEQVRTLLVRTLTRAGYGTLAAASGEEGLELFERQPEEVVAVVSDVGLPGMSGLRLCTELSKRRKDLPVVLISGHVSGEQAREEIAASGLPLLHKPFAPATLLQALGRLLGESAS